MAKVISDEVLFQKLSDGDVALKELYYHKFEVKGCLKTFRRHYGQALRKSERSTRAVSRDFLGTPFHEMVIFPYQHHGCLGVKKY